VYTLLLVEVRLAEPDADVEAGRDEVEVLVEGWAEVGRVEDGASGCAETGRVEVDGRMEVVPAFPEEVFPEVALPASTGVRCDAEAETLLRLDSTPDR
jgi:hypothetical protein